MKVERILIAVLALALMLTLGMRLGQAQVQGPMPMPQPQENRPAAVLQDRIPIQGRLTDASGNPLNGTYTVHFYVYDAAVGGTLLCGNLDDTVDVTNGLFNHTIDLCDAADAFEGDQLYLGVQVGADPEMTPRQPIYAVPYAYNVKKGAIIKGATSYLFVPGTAFITETEADTTRWDVVGGSVMIRRGATAGNKHIRIPITIPAVLYGQPVRVTSITVYYRCQNGTNNYIYETVLYKHTDADSWALLVNDSTNRTSNTATSYSLSTDTANYTLSSTEGILTLRLSLAFANETDYVQIGGVRLTLVHDY